MGSWAERTWGKAAAEGSGWARQRLTGKVAAGGPSEAAAGGAGGPTFVCR